MSVAIFVDIAVCTLSLLTSQEQMREHPMAQVVYLHKPCKALFASAYCEAISQPCTRKRCQPFLLLVQLHEIMSDSRLSQK